MAWFQCSIFHKGNRKLPERVFEVLLPTVDLVMGQQRWHYLFEPNLLIRTENCDNETNLGILDIAAIHLCNLERALGDTAKSSPGGKNGPYDFVGEQEFYGSEDLWQRNADWLCAGSRLIIQLERENKRDFLWIRKHVHLFCNQAGMHYGQECWFAFRWMLRTAWLFVKYGRQ